MISGLLSSVLSVIYPQECRVCGQHVESLSADAACKNCWHATRVFTGNEMVCGKCGAYHGENGSALIAFCHECGTHQYDIAKAAGIYEKALAASVVSLKTVPFVPKNARNHLISAFERMGYSDTSLIIPVPLSKRRRFERGHNQAELLADKIGKHSGIKVDKLSLARTVHTPAHRVAMDRRARELTVIGAFEVTRPRFIDGQAILLVDDVFTTGSTASQCAKVLKKHGASKVNVLTLARAV